MGALKWADPGAKSVAQDANGTSLRLGVANPGVKGPSPSFLVQKKRTRHALVPSDASTLRAHCENLGPNPGALNDG